MMVVSRMNRFNVQVTNAEAGEAESVVGRMGFHPRLTGADLRHIRPFVFQGEQGDGIKQYSRLLDAPVRPLRHFRGSVEVIDAATLYDHDYAQYDAAWLGFVYTVRRP